MRLFLRLAAIGLVATAACRPWSPAPPGPTDTARLTALLVNGGGTIRSNYWSHLLHLREMRALLLDAGVPADRIWLFASDGDDPAPDLATRTSTTHSDDWILGGGQLDRRLQAKIELVDSAIDGARLQRADRAGIAAWFAGVGATLQPGDTLLLFVTDHGTRNKEDPTDNFISLWGKGERLSVRELGTMIDEHVDPGVRVLSVMSQCFSGSFAHLTSLDAAVTPSRQTCGYFSTTATRPAYGCYPEAAERDDRGHAIRMAAALSALGGLPAAHEATLVWDDTPDVPLRTSDVFLESVLRATAKRIDTDFETLVDRELTIALAEPERWEPTLRLLDDVAEHYGLFSPRRLAELDARTEALTALARSFRRHRRAWQATRASAADANVQRWLAVDEAWQTQLTAANVGALSSPERSELRAAVLHELRPRTRRDERTWNRLARLHDTTEAAEGVTYRTEVRLGILLRLRQLLLRIAGESHIARVGTPAERARLQELVACERLRLSTRPRERRELEPPKPALPRFGDDEALARTFQPSWLGVRFQTPPEALAQSTPLPAGAAFVTAVFEGSAAEAAGVEPGDVILGPPGEPFREPDQLREWTMFHSRGEPAALRVLRARQPIDVSVSLQPYPTEFPSLPAPPADGDVAPALSVSPYRGMPPTSLASGRKTLLFFWATWCGFCKAALPALEEIGRERGIDVVAISDEPSRLLDRFFASHHGYFPSTVAIDPMRATFLSYGVNGMPTFVLVGPDGRIEKHHVGYSRKKPLPF